MAIRFVKGVALPWLTGPFFEGDTFEEHDPRLKGKADLLVRRGYAERVGAPTASDAKAEAKTTDSLTAAALKKKM